MPEDKTKQGLKRQLPPTNNVTDSNKINNSNLTYHSKKKNMSEEQAEVQETG